mmetsp:Transcript_8802/g.29009  ORF Transcript_8802/g.29009 Transcript_8802/m.29009 type:complete len:260 (-) Transcript_8802:2643-3422(-)
MAGDEDVAHGQLGRPHDGHQRRRLARAVGAEEAEAGALCDAEGGVVDGDAFRGRGKGGHDVRQRHVCQGEARRVLGAVDLAEPLDDQGVLARLLRRLEVLDVGLCKSAAAQRRRAHHRRDGLALAQNVGVAAGVHGDDFGGPDARELVQPDHVSPVGKDDAEDALDADDERDADRRGPRLQRLWQRGDEVDQPEEAGALRRLEDGEPDVCQGSVLEREAVAEGPDEQKGYEGEDVAAHQQEEFKWGQQGEAVARDVEEV